MQPSAYQADIVEEMGCQQDSRVPNLSLWDEIFVITSAMLLMRRGAGLWSSHEAGSLRLEGIVAESFRPE